MHKPSRASGQADTPERSRLLGRRDFIRERTNMENVELRQHSQIRIALNNEMSEWLSRSRAIHVARALQAGNVQRACTEYLAQQSDALTVRRRIEAGRPLLRRIAMSRKRKCEILPLIEKMLRSNDDFVSELGKTICAIRRAYSARSFL